MSRDTTEIEAEQARQAEERQQTLAGIADGEPVRGNPDAPVTIVEYSDFQCPFCARGYQTMEPLITRATNVACCARSSAAACSCPAPG